MQSDQGVVLAPGPAAVVAPAVAVAPAAAVVPEDEENLPEGDERASIIKRFVRNLMSVPQSALKMAKELKQELLQKGTIFNKKTQPLPTIYDLKCWRKP